jgi:hypothetical protein
MVGWYWLTHSSVLTGESGTYGKKTRLPPKYYIKLENYSENFFKSPDFLPACLQGRHYQVSRTLAKLRPQARN